MNRIEALQLLEDLLEDGFSVSVEGDALAVAPRSRITDTLREQIQAAKPALVDLLDPAPPEGPCGCGSVVYVRKRLGGWTCWRCGDLPPETIHETYAGLGWHEGAT